MFLFRHLQASVLRSIFFIMVTVSSAIAQAQSPFVRVVNGMTLSVVSSRVSRNSVILQFTLANDTNTRVYLKDVKSDENQRGFLGSGAQLESPKIAGINNCSKIALTYCFSNEAENTDLSRYSYVEPKDAISFAFEYAAPNVTVDDTISFSVVLVARNVRQNGDPDSDAGAPHGLRFNFNRISLARN